MKRTNGQQAIGDRCAKCGACTAVCPVYQVSGRETFTARGRLHLLSRLRNFSSPSFGKIVSACLLCGACREACPRKIDTLSPLIGARESLPLSARYHYLEKLVARKTLASPRLLGGFAKVRKKLLEHLPKSSGLRMRLALLPDDFALPPLSFTPNIGQQEANRPAVAYFSGCFARFLHQDISTATDFLTEKATGNRLLIPEEQTCCGLASFAAGDTQEAQALARKNITAFAGNSLPILTSCASCYSHLRSYPDLLADAPDWYGPAQAFAARLREFSRFFLDSGLCQPSVSLTKHQAGTSGIFYHDPCHLRFGPEKTTDQPRALLTNIIGTPPLESADGPHCCGQGGLFQLAHPELSRQIFTQAVTQFSKLSASHIVTTCSGCLLQWQQGKFQAGFAARVSHMAVLLAQRISQRDMR